ncbi:uncharacterized protein LOC134774725 [Penaeus indicus]|uniref:uncharacterized protein LOC134774725 n=1 Tax=Penaeus indicus TaxID=29960 RepID=UPI00300CEEE4
MDRGVNFRIQCGWNNWRKVSGVICDKRVPVRLKGKVHKAVVKPTLIYGLEAAPLKKSEEKMNAAEMKMLRWMEGVTRRDRIRNEYIRVKVVGVSKKIQELRLRCSHTNCILEHEGKSIRTGRPLGRPSVSEIRENSNLHSYQFKPLDFKTLTSHPISLDLIIEVSLHIINMSPELNGTTTATTLFTIDTTTQFLNG